MTESEAEGNSTDRNVFVFLILAALFVLKRRQVSWLALISNNRWLFILYVYLGVSVLWSDYPFVSFTRWFKEFGNVVMVFLILTERDPVKAVTAVFARTAYLLIPLSVLFIKYYPDLGRSFSRWTGEVFYHGAALGKNELGGTLLVLTIFLIWELLQMKRKRLWRGHKTEILGRLVLLIMAIWLFHMAKSATSLACAVVGSIALFALNTEFAYKRRRTLLP
ncbi:MAG TPA: hypothetical protein VFQ43_14355, partial [Nitrososphaera sp.]|nr:hypothetical protein [Nitrososphaera sp.]